MILRLSNVNRVPANLQNDDSSIRKTLGGKNVFYLSEILKLSSIFNKINQLFFDSRQNSERLWYVLNKH